MVYKVRFKSGGLSILTGLSTFKNDAQILKLSTDLGRANIGIKSPSLKETVVCFLDVSTVFWSICSMI